MRQMCTALCIKAGTNITAASGGRRYIVASTVKHPLPAKKRLISELLRTDVKYILGLSISKDTAGYAVTEYATGATQKLGVIELHTLPHGAERAAEVVGTLTVLKHTHKLSPGKAEGDGLCNRVGSASTDSENIGKQWVVGLEEYLRVPHNGREASQTNNVMKMIGVIESECANLFGQPPFVVNPKVARQHLNKDATHPLSNREKLLSYAQSQVTNFPVMKDTRNRISPKTYFMSDAWAVAQYTKQLYEIRLIKSDAPFLRKLNSVIEKDRRVLNLRETIRNISDPEIEEELQTVLQSRVDKLMEGHIAEALRNRSTR